jgi:hypothetical protein
LRKTEDFNLVVDRVSGDCASGVVVVVFSLFLRKRVEHQREKKQNGGGCFLSV